MGSSVAILCAGVCRERVTYFSLLHRILVSPRLETSNPAPSIGEVVLFGGVVRIQHGKAVSQHTLKVVAQMAMGIVLDLLVLMLPDRAIIRVADVVWEWWWAAILVLLGAQILFRITDSVLAFVEEFQGRMNSKHLAGPPCSATFAS
jgi:hypothetical protein